MNDTDVLIIGGGPAGTSAALALDAGQRAVIVDKRKAPWSKPCDGVLTPASQSVLKSFGIDPIRDLGANSVPMLRVLDFDNGRESQICLPNHLIVPRMALDQTLQRQVADRTDVEFLDSTWVLRVHPDAEGFTMDVLREGKRSELRTRLLVDASGAYGISRRSTCRPLPCVLACQHWYRPENSIVRFDWIFDHSATPFYLWAINNGSALALGAIVPIEKPRQGSWAIENRLKTTLGIQGQPYRTETALMAMPAGPQHFWFGSGRLFAAGEAAGLINSGTGEGISFGLRSGRICGRAIAAARGSEAMASRIYREHIAGVVRECERKACHARRLFDPRSRGELSSEELLASVKCSEVPEWVTSLAARA